MASGLHYPLALAVSLTRSFPHGGKNNVLEKAATMTWPPVLNAAIWVLSNRQGRRQHGESMIHIKKIFDPSP
jgi:hypothetical protein